jgi:hypothetical protein
MSTRRRINWVSHYVTPLVTAASARAKAEEHHIPCRVVTAALAVIAVIARPRESSSPPPLSVCLHNERKLYTLHPTPYTLHP